MVAVAVAVVGGLGASSGWRTWERNLVGRCSSVSQLSHTSSSQAPHCNEAAAVSHKPHVNIASEMQRASGSEASRWRQQSMRSNQLAIRTQSKLQRQH